MRAWQAVIHALEAERIKYVFGLPGGGTFYDALAYSQEIKPVLVREESSGAFMAMGYAKIAGTPGICYASPGPGVANLVPGIMEAESAGLPVIALASAANERNAGMGAFQDADQIAIMKPITKWCVRITQPERVTWAIRRAFSLAMNGKPGPVFIEIPKDVAEKEVDMPDYVPAEYPLRTVADGERIESAASLLLESERPVIVAGGGAISSRAFNEVRELAETLNMPVMTTPSGRGIIAESHPLAFGVVGLYFTRVGERVYDEADLLLTIGSRNEDFQSGCQRFFPEGAKYIQIDIAHDEIGRNWIPDVALVGDAKLTLQSLVTSIREKIPPQEGNPNSGEFGYERIARLIQAKEEYEREIAAECQTDSVPIKTKRIIRELNEVFGRNTILVNENGSQDLWAYYCPYYKVLDTNSCVAPGEQTCMGGGVAAAIGVKLAAPEKKVVCTTGDGAFQMFMKELPTAVQYHAPVTYILLNNFSLGWIKYNQKRKGIPFTAVDFEVQPDFVKIAEANSCYGQRVEQPDAIKPALENALRVTEKGVPAVIEFIVDGWDVAYGFSRYYERLSG